MKKIFKRLAAAFSAFLMLTSAVSVPVSAEETEDKTVLPSGYTLELYQRKLYDMAHDTMYGEQWYASAAIGVFDGEKVLSEDYIGKINIEDNIPADENSVYEWGSISKTLIWVSAMQLYEQELLDLERDVREYLPDGFFRKLSYDEPITMLNLMNHNAGWQETTRPIFKTSAEEILPLGEALKEIEPMQTNRPGEVGAYSNYGAAVAGYVIECITGQDYCEYVHENIFKPLGMEHTSLNSTHSDNEWVQQQRKKTKSYKFFLGNTIDLGNRLDYIPAYPAGSATGTLSDLIIYGQALMNDDAPLFDDPATQKLMYTGTDFYGSSDIPICAHGFWCTEYAVRTYGHSGATTAGQANLLFDLESKTGLAIMVNESGRNVFLADIPAMVFGELSPDKYASGETKEAKLSGYYLLARSTNRGMLKFVSYLSAVPSKSLNGTKDIGDGVYMLENVIIGSKTLPDGRDVLRQPSVDLIYDRFYIVKICLLTLYILAAVAAFYLLRVRHKLRKHGKYTPYRGAAAINAGEWASLISVIALLAMYAVYARFDGGVPYTAGAGLGIVQMLCAAVCAASAGTSCIALVSHKNEKALTVRYILNTVGCLLPVIAIIYFEMYRFWGC